MANAYVRRDQLPANEQRPPGNPEEQKAGPRKVTAFDGEFVEARDFATTSEDVSTPKEVEAEHPQDEAFNEDTFTCEECGKEFKTERGMNSHIEAKHSESQ